MLLPAAALALITALTKFGGGWLIARRAGLGTTGRLRAGALLIARGEFSIVLAVIAVASGLEFAGPFVAAYVLILVIVGPLVTRVVQAATTTTEPAPA